MPKPRKRKLNRDSDETAESAAVAPRGKRNQVRPGTFNRDGELFTPEGILVQRVKADLTQTDALKLVRKGARVAFEGCGCGGDGGGGCVPAWSTSEDSAAAVAIGEPRFTDEHGAPTWIEHWSGEGQTVVFLHGDIRWGTIAC
ncbi:hypothetical protein [Leifsonia sp. RAF41]|uniref:hypothetical protein n=1 Tax=Leifsonia sp. RAF41 TaxID=3233056 RepID=UPI003F96BAD8